MSIGKTKSQLFNQLSNRCLILEFATWRRVFDSSGMCVLTCFKEVSRRPVLGDLECHFVQPHMLQMGMSGPREGTPVAQLGAPEASGRTRTSAQSRGGGRGLHSSGLLSNFIISREKKDKHRKPHSLP